MYPSNVIGVLEPVSTHSVADIQLDLKLMNDRVHIMAYTMSSFVLCELKNIRDLETGDEATLFIINFDLQQSA